MNKIPKPKIKTEAVRWTGYSATRFVHHINEKVIEKNPWKNSQILNNSLWKLEPLSSETRNKPKNSAGILTVGFEVKVGVFFFLFFSQRKEGKCRERELELTHLYSSQSLKLQIKGEVPWGFWVSLVPNIYFLN